ncbi:MAG: hypothetical protein Q8L89_02265 [Gammaproteobacteria bacterium]|nr:hypothetical protein [Gammaproteobacteria bacterium]
MVFSYYHRLSKRQQQVYQRSDAISVIVLPEGAGLQSVTAALAQALELEDRAAAESTCQRIADGIAERLNVTSLRIKVLARRPKLQGGELHGIYERTDTAKATIKLWMRTVERRQVVAFRTFFRTLIHELCHHLDYEWLKLTDSLHTEGFYKRESSLVRQLAGAHEALAQKTKC